jgi:hypothetical protein
VGSTLVPLQPNCKFSGQMAFARLPRHHKAPVGLAVVVRYNGNGYLTPRKARIEAVTLG